MGKWQKIFKEKYPHSTMELGDNVDIASNNPASSTLSPAIQKNFHKSYKDSSALSTMSPCNPQSSSEKLPPDKNKIAELRILIEQVGKHAGEDEEFLQEYINDITNDWAHDLNKALTCFSELAALIPKPPLIHKKYNPVSSKFVICSDCIYFQIDKIGDGAGIGFCKLGLLWTEEAKGRFPLFRYAPRNCEQFKESVNNSE